MSNQMKRLSTHVYSVQEMRLPPQLTEGKSVNPVHVLIKGGSPAKCCKFQPMVVENPIQGGQPFTIPIPCSTQCPHAEIIRGVTEDEGGKVVSESFFYEVTCEGANKKFALQNVK